MYIFQEALDDNSLDAILLIPNMLVSYPIIVIGHSLSILDLKDCAICCKSLLRNGLRRAGRAAAVVSPYTIRVYVKSL